MNRGFTMMEMAVVVLLIAIVVPGIFVFARMLERERAAAHWKLEVASEAETVSDQLRLDARNGKLMEGNAVQFESPSCGPVVWSTTASHVLMRSVPASCGEPRAVATSVLAISRGPNGVVVDFAKPNQTAPLSERLLVPVLQ